MDQKLQLMWNISREFSINWDSKAFRERISNSVTSASVSIPEDFLLNSLSLGNHMKRLDQIMRCQLSFLYGASFFNKL